MNDEVDDSFDYSSLFGSGEQSPEASETPEVVVEQGEEKKEIPQVPVQQPQHSVDPIQHAQNLIAQEKQQKEAFAAYSNHVSQQYDFPDDDPIYGEFSSGQVKQIQALLTKAHVNTQTATMHQMLQALPNIIPQFANQTLNHRQEVGGIFEKHSDIADPEAQETFFSILQSSGQKIIRSNPGITKDQIYAKVAGLTRGVLGRKAPGSSVLTTPHNSVRSQAGTVPARAGQKAPEDTESKLWADIASDFRSAGY